MATLMLEIDDQTLEQAEEISRITGVDYKRALADRLHTFVSEAGYASNLRQRRIEALERLMQSADAFPAYSDHQLTSEDRNER
jgi:hypothetical protein